MSQKRRRSVRIPVNKRGCNAPHFWTLDLRSLHSENEVNNYDEEDTEILRQMRKLQGSRRLIDSRTTAKIQKTLRLGSLRYQKKIVALRLDLMILNQWKKLLSARD
jgi:hypothetical protein